MPSFRTDFPIDYKIKRGLIVDVMKKLCLDGTRKLRYRAEQKAKMDERSGLLMKAKEEAKFKEDELNYGAI